MQQCFLAAGPLQVLHIAGKANVLADIASRAIQNCDDPSFLTQFNSLFPLPAKNTSWLCACPPPDHQLSNLILTLRVQRLQLQRRTTPPALPAGDHGGLFTVTSAALTRGSPTAPLSVQQQLFLGFAARVRTGFFGTGRPADSQTVKKAIRHVAHAARVLAGLTDPRQTTGRNDLY